MKKVKKIFFKAIVLLIIIGIAGTNVLAQESSTRSSDLHEKVDERIERVLARPKAVLGSLTDKTEVSMQIQTEDGEIQLASYTEETGVLKLDENGKYETRTLDDVAIGDFVTTIGKKNEQSVLETELILLNGSSHETDRKIFKGNVVTTERSLLGLKTTNGDEIDVVVNRYTEITQEIDGELEEVEFASISEDDVAIISGIEDEESFTARNIHILKKSQTFDE